MTTARDRMLAAETHDEIKSIKPDCDAEVESANNLYNHYTRLANEQKLLIYNVKNLVSESIWRIDYPNG